MEKKNTVIFCTSADNNTLLFFIRVGRSEYYLFSSRFNYNSFTRFRTPVQLVSALDFGRVSNNKGMMKLTKRFWLSVNYIEKEYSLMLLNSTIKKKEKDREWEKKRNTREWDRGMGIDNCGLEERGLEEPDREIA